jgi:hypothetical protein
LASASSSCRRGASARTPKTRAKPRRERALVRARMRASNRSLSTCVLLTAFSAYVPTSLVRIHTVAACQTIHIRQGTRRSCGPPSTEVCTPKASVDRLTGHVYLRSQRRERRKPAPLRSVTVAGSVHRLWFTGIVERTLADAGQTVNYDGLIPYLIAI